MDRRQRTLVEGDHNGRGCGCRQESNERRRDWRTRAAGRTGSTLAGLMLCSRMMIGVSIRRGKRLMFMRHRYRVVVHRLVIMLCGRRRRRTEGHRRRREALEGQREQRNPDDQDSQNGVHI